MKVLNTMLAAVAIVLLVSGCSKKPLNYVPEDAEFVVYLNAEKALDSKVWEMLEDDKTFSKEVLKEFKKETGISDIEDLAGKAVLWGRFKNKEPEADGMVIILNEDKAEILFEKLRDKADDNGLTVKKTDIDDHEAIVIYVDENRKKCFGGIVLVSDRELHFTFGEEPEIFEKTGASKIASAIDSSAIMAVATNGEALDDLVGNETDIDNLDDIGIIKSEVFCSRNEITVKASADISELK